jgi:hypothetical protein
MKRTLAAIAVAGIAMLSMGAVVGTASAAGESGKSFTAACPDAFINEFATRGSGPNGQFKEFIELRSNMTVDISGYKILATFGTSKRPLTLAEIPEGVVLQPGQAYLLASARFEGQVVPDQIFNTSRDIPDAIGIALVPRGTAEPADVVGTTSATPFYAVAPTSPLTPSEASANLSIHRFACTGVNVNDFGKAAASPGWF